MRKKSILSFAGILICFAVSAQGNEEPLVDRSLVFDLVNICAVITGLYIVSGLVVKLLQQYLDNRLKSRMVDAGTPETIIAQVLQKKERDNRKTALQWICVLAPLSAALFIIDALGRVTLSSAGILAGCIALGLLAYYLLTKNSHETRLFPGSMLPCFPAGIF